MLDPASLELPGDGPTVALDARGLGSDEVMRYVAEHDLCARTIVVVDDPNVATLRDANVFYEYAPETPEVPADRRMRWIVSAYGVERIDIAGPSSTAPLSNEPLAARESGAAPVNKRR